jgi:long-chain acyl-CoA synthetase
MSTIQEFFTGKTVLVTGATGFLGKALVEKILRSLPGIRRVYLLIRPKERASRQVDADERFWGEVLKSSIFDRLKSDLGPGFDGFVEERIAVVNGDLTDERLGVSDDDYRRLCDEVEVLINSAAVVNFDERLDVSLNLNTMGARRMLDFARDCTRLRAIVHISTCYVSGTREGWVPEEVAAPSFDVEAEAQRLDAECAAIRQRSGGDKQKAKEQLVTLGLTGARALGWHDTYTFTKWMGEQLIAKHRGNLPMVILRPAIIESTYREPEAGWIDGFRMGDPIFVGYGKGQLKDFPGRPDTICDLIPCDHVVNAILACVPRCAAEGGFRVYQVATGDQNPVHFRTIYDVGSNYFKRNPMYERDGTRIPNPEWTFPDPAVYRRKLLWRYGMPLSIGATLLRPLSFIRKIDKFRRKLAVKRAGLDLLLYYIDIYSPYAMIRSRYATANTQELWAGLSPEDQALFDFDARAIDWRDYIANVHIPGLKRNVLNLTVEELEEGSGTPLRIIPDLLARSADRAPEAVALQMKRDGVWVRFTFDELERRVEAAAARMHALQIGKGDRVVLYADNQPEWGAAYLAAVSLGAVVVPADRQLRKADVLAMAHYVDARAILTSETVYASFGDEARQADGAPQFLNINAGCSPFVAGGGCSVEGEEESSPATLQPPPATHHHASLVGPDDLASIIFTTGVSSSDPRAVMLTHRNFVSNVMGVVQLLPPRANDNFISVLPLHHALEFTGGFLVPLYVGATVTYCDTMRSRVILETMRETQATTLIGVPRVFQILHDALRRQMSQRGQRAWLWFDTVKLLSRMVYAVTGRNVGLRLFAGIHRELGGKLRAFVCGGATLAPQIFDHFTALGFELCEGYGLTECGPVATANPLGAARKGSVGLPLPGVEVDIVAPDEDGVGEVAIRGPNVTPGYFNNPDATERVLRDGWLHTGDVGRLDGERYLYLTGRIKEIIVTAAGKNVYPDEVERLYAGLPLVSQICVVGVWDDEVLGETIHGVLVPDREGLHSGRFEERVRQAVQDRSRTLPTYQRLQRIHVVEQELPRNALGVVDRSRVKQDLLHRLRSPRPAAVLQPTARNGSHNGGQHALEESMRAIVSRLAGVPRSQVGPRSDLEADLRLDSLSKVELLLALETHYQVPLPETVGYTLHTFGDVLEAVRQRVDADVAVVDQPELVPQWGRVLAPKGYFDDGPWLQAPLGKRAVRALTRALMRFYAWSWFGFEVRGVENLPPGGFIVAANHCSHLDTGAVVTAFGSRGHELFIMGARDYFFNRRLKGWFFHTFLKVIPFDRTEKVLEGLRLARSVLVSGRPVLIYPEGKRSVGGELQSFKPGIGLLGVELGVPIVPCLIDGTFAAMPKGRAIPGRSKVRVTFAPPVRMEQYRAQHPDDDRVALYRRIADDVRSVVLKMQGETRQ